MKIRLLQPSISIVVFALLFAYKPAKAALFTWNGGSGNWNNPANWVITGTPTTSTFPGQNAGQLDSVIINSSGTVTINSPFNNSSVRYLQINTGTVIGNNVTGIINGDLLIAAGSTFNLSQITLTVLAATTINGSLIDGNNTGTNTFVGLVTINDGGNFSTTNSSSYIFQGGLSAGATAIVNLQGGGSKDFTTNNQTINFLNAQKELADTRVRISPMRIQGGITVTNLGYLQVNDITQTGTGIANFINSTNSTLYTLGGTPLTSANVNFDFSTFVNTVNYNAQGANQNIAALTYHNLVVSNYGNSGNRTKLLSGATTVNGKLTVEGNCINNLQAILNLNSGNLIVQDSVKVLCQGVIRDGNSVGTANYNGKVVVYDNGTFNLEQTTATFADSVTVIGGSFQDNSNNGTTTFQKWVDIQSAGTWNTTGNTTTTNLNFQEGFNNDGSCLFNAAAFNGVNNQDITGTQGVAFTNGFRIVTGITVTNKITVAAGLSTNLARVNNAGSTFVNQGIFNFGGGAELPVVFNDLVTLGNFQSNFTGSVTNYNRNGDQPIRSLTYANLVVSGTGTKTPNGNINILEDLSVIGGAATLDIGTNNVNRTTSGGTFTIEDGNTLIVRGADNFPKNFTTNDLANTSTVNYNRAINATQSIAAVNYGNLTFGNNNAAAVKVALGNLSVSNTLTLNGASGGRFDLAGFDLTLGANATIAGTPNNNNHIDLTNGGSVYKYFDATGEFTYPVGSNNLYLPARLNMTAATFAGAVGTRYVRLSTIPTIAPNQLDTTYSLNRHYVLETQNISNVNGNFKFAYRAADLPITVTPPIEALYVTGFWNGTSWTANNTTDVDETADTAFISFATVSSIAGNYTAAPLAAFYKVRYYSRANGNWEDGNSWSIISHAGAAYGLPPLTGSVVYVGNNNNITITTAAAKTIDTINIYSGGRLDIGNFNTLTANALISTSGNATLALSGLAGDTARFPNIVGVKTFFNSPTRTIEYTGTTNYYIPDTANYVNLTVSGTGIKRLTSAVSMTGNLMVAANSNLYTEHFQITGAGNTATIQAGATLRVGNPDSTINVSFPNGFTNYSINGTSTIRYSANTNQTIRTLTYGNLVTETSGNKTIQGSLLINGNLEVNGTSVFVFGTTLRQVFLNGNLSGTGTLNMQSANHQLYLKGATNSIGALVTSANSSLIRYDGNTNQQVFSSPNYRLFQTGGSGTKIIQASGLIAASTELRDNSILSIPTNNFKINLGGTTINPNASLQVSGQGIKVTTTNLTANGSFILNPNFTSASEADTIQINGNLTIGTGVNSGFTVSNFAGPQRATATTRVNITGSVTNGKNLSISDNTQIRFSGNWINNSTVTWTNFEGRYPKVTFVRNGGIQTVQNGAGLNNFPEVEIAQTGGARVELLKDMRVGSHFTLTSGTFVCGQLVGTSQDLLVTGDWRSNGAAFNPKTATVFLEGNVPTLIGTTAGTPNNSGANFYNLSIVKTGTGANRIVQNTTATTVTVRVANNFSVLSGTYRVRDRIGAVSDTDLVVKKNVFIANNACLDITGGSVNTTNLHAEAANIHIYIGGDLTDQNINANTFGNNSNGFYMGTINTDNSITNKPTLHFNGIGVVQTVTGSAANSGSRGGPFTGITLPNVEIDGVNNTLFTGSAVRIRGYTHIQKTAKLLVAGAIYGYYGFLLNDGAIANTPPHNYFVALRVDSGATFEAQPGANIFIHPRSKIFADTNSNLNLVGTFADPISFIRDGSATPQRHSHEYHGNIAARFVRYQVGDAGGNDNITTSQCGGNISACLYISDKATLSPFPNNFSNSDFSSVNATFGIWIDAPLTVGVNDTLVGNTFGGNPNTYSCHRTLGLATPVIFKNSGGIRGGAIFGPQAECDSTAPAPLRASTGRVRWTTSTTIRWTGDQDTNWFNTNNWIPAQVPSRLDIVQIPTGRYRYPSLTANASAGQLGVGTTVSSDPLVAPIGTIQYPHIKLNSFTLDMEGDSLNVLGDVEIANVIGGGTNAYIDLGTGRLRLQGNLQFSQAVTAPANDTVRGIRPNQGTIEFYAGRTVGMSVAVNNANANVIFKFYNLEIDKGNGFAEFKCGQRLFVNDFILKSGSFKHGTCADESPLFITGNMNITAGAFHDNRGEIVQFISNTKTPRTIKTGGNVYRRFYLLGGVGARYTLQDSLSVNTGANAVLHINNGDTLETANKTIIARTIQVSDTAANNSMLKIDAGGTLLMNNGGTVNISPNAQFEAIGNTNDFATINCLTVAGNYAFTVNGTIRAKYYKFERLNADGLNIGNGFIDNADTNNLSYGIFDYGAQRQSNHPAGPARYITFNANSTAGINYTFKNVTFANTGNRTPYKVTDVATPNQRLANAGVNNLAGTGTNIYTFKDANGTLAGVTAAESEYDNPGFNKNNGFIRWIRTGVRWTGAIDTDWHKGGNWTSGTVPTQNDNVVLSHSDKAGAYTVNITNTAKAVCRSLTIINSNEGSGLALGNITLNINNQDLDVKKEVSLSSGAASIMNLSANRTLSIGTSMFNNGVFNAADNSNIIFYGNGLNPLGVANCFNLTITDSIGANTYQLNDTLLVRGTLTIDSNSTLDVTTANYTITLRGNYNPYGTLQFRNGVFNFKGSNPQFINANAAFNRVFVDKPTENIYIPSHTFTVNELLFLIKGNIRTSFGVYPATPTLSASTGEVIIAQNGEISIASSSAFIDGRLTQYFKNSITPSLKTYPIGKGNSDGYTPVDLRVRLTSPTPTRIRGEMFTRIVGDSVPFTNLGSYPSCPNANMGWGHNIDHVSLTRYWQFDKLDATAIDSAKITLPWNVDDGVLVPSNLAIVKGNGVCLDMLNTTFTQAIGNQSAGTISSNVNFTTFSPFTFSTELPYLVNPLPLDLLSFTGKHVPQQQANELQWVTVNERNVSHFLVEKSQDGNQFEPIGTVKAKGINDQQAQYSFLDNKPFVLTYYRLKMIDENDSFEYSPIITIKAEKQGKDEIVGLYPNPAKDLLNIELRGTGTLRITDLTGKVLIEKYMADKPLEQINVAHWTSGMYLVEWFTDNNKSVKKFVKQ